FSQAPAVFEHLRCSTNPSNSPDPASHNSKIFLEATSGLYYSFGTLSPWLGTQDILDSGVSMKNLNGFYLSRPTDEALLQAARRWLSGDSRAHRISLTSAPGRGNTALLENFVREAAEQQYSLDETRIVFVKGSDALPSEIPKRLLPISNG